VKKLVQAKQTVLVESGAGAGASIAESEFAAAGATVVATAAELYRSAELLLKVRAPSGEELAQIRKDAVLIGLLDPYRPEGIAALAAHGLTAFAMERLPRISRA
jgi:NAD(P) transhydrogenase subunit alpha